MNKYVSIFYGDISPKGNKISYLLISREIKHSLVISDDYFFILSSIQKTRELVGFDEIFGYLNEYKYIFDFPEVDFWNS